MKLLDVNRQSSHKMLKIYIISDCKYNLITGWFNNHESF